MESPGQKEILEAHNSLHPGVAVVIPFFNQIDKLRRTTESLIDQVLRPALVVFVDDYGSERMEPDILLSMEDAGIKTILVLNERNLGPGGSRQAGFKQVPEDIDYVLFLDSDDHLSEQFLSSSVKLHKERPDVIATYGDSVYQSTGSSRMGPLPFPSNLLDGMVRSRPWGTGAILWKRSLLKDVEWNSWKNFEDSHFELSAAMVNPHIAFVPDAVLYVDQVFSMDRMRERNRMFEKNDIIAYRSKIFESILMDFPFRRHGIDSGEYVRQCAYHVSRLFPEGPGAYLSLVVRLALHGRLQAAWQTAFRFPHYLQSRRSRKGRYPHS